MQAIVLHPENPSFAIVRGNLDAIKAAYRSRAMTTHGFIGNDSITDTSDFLEWCFEHTNLSEEYEKKHNTRGMSVGDVLALVEVGGAYACMPSGWERTE